MRKTPEISCEHRQGVNVHELAFCSRYAKSVQNVLRESKWHSLWNFQHFPLSLLSFVNQARMLKDNTFSNKQLKST